MNRRQRRMVAIVVAVLAGLFLYSQFQSRQQQAAEAQRKAEEARRKAEEERKKLLEEVPYVVPTERIPRRTVITDSMIRVVSAPKKDIPWAKKKETLADYPQTLEEVVGKIALVELGAKEPIRKERLAGKTDLRALSFIIEPGKRAVTIKMDAVRGVGGFIRQGDRVDVLATFPVGGETITKPILQNVKILVVDRTFFRPLSAEEEEEQKKAEEEGGKKRRGPRPNEGLANLAMVTFEVTPQEAETLMLAAERLRLSLALRNSIDDEVLGPEYVQSDEEVFVDPNRPPPEPAGKVEVILGEAKSVKTVGR